MFRIIGQRGSGSIVFIAHLESDYWKEDSLDRLFEKGIDFSDDHYSLEDSVITMMMSEMLHKALDKLSSAERELIEALFFANDGRGMTERDCAKLFNLSKTALHARKKKTLMHLKIYFENNL